MCPRRPTGFAASPYGWSSTSLRAPWPPVEMPRGSRPRVDVDGRALERPRLHLAQSDRGGKILEQTDAFPDGDGMGDQPVLVDEAEADERLRERRAAKATTSLSVSRRSRSISSASSPRATRDSGQPASSSSRVLEKTTFGISFIGCA